LTRNTTWLGAAALIALALALPRPAFAYLDPATGSMLMQLLVGGVAGLAVAVKVFWHRILAFFGGKPAADDEPAG
jgi:hypothetical protein